MYNSNSLLGAILQFWTVDEKPRLYPRNSWFYDHQISVKHGSRFWIIFTVLALAISVLSCLGGVFL